MLLAGMAPTFESHEGKLCENEYGQPGALEQLLEQLDGWDRGFRRILTVEMRRRNCDDMDMTIISSLARQDLERLV